MGLASGTSVSSFVGATTPYLIAASAFGMVVWSIRLFRRTGHKTGNFARIVVRQGVVMGAIYGVTLGATMLWGPSPAYEMKGGPE